MKRSLLLTAFVLTFVGLGLVFGFGEAQAVGGCAPGDASTACGWAPSCDGMCIVQDYWFSTLCRGAGSSKPCIECNAMN